MDSIAIGRQEIVSPALPRDGQTKTGSGNGFSDALLKAVSEVNQLHQNADKAIQNIQTGQSDSLHEAVIALEKADISFRAMLTVRNKLIEAYQEVMRMQV
jgi:flagellar hook-basal body complex protein FliE